MDLLKASPSLWVAQLWLHRQVRAPACNYDPAATDDDGTCEYETCGGCTDATACNYDAAALLDDGSCCFDSCVTISMNNNGDGWNGAEHPPAWMALKSEQAPLKQALCERHVLFAAGCYSIEVTEAIGPVKSAGAWCLRWLVHGGAAESVTFNVGSGDQCVVGCDIACACNYDPATV